VQNCTKDRHLDLRPTNSILTFHTDAFFGIVVSAYSNCLGGCTRSGRRRSGCFRNFSGSGMSCCQSLLRQPLRAAFNSAVNQIAVVFHDCDLGVKTELLGENFFLQAFSVNQLAPQLPEFQLQCVRWQDGQPLVVGSLRLGRVACGCPPSCPQSLQQSRMCAH